MSEEIAPLDVDLDDNHNARDWITLCSNDGLEFSVRPRIIEASSVLSAMTQGNERIIRLEVDGNLLEHVIRFLEHYSDSPFHEIGKPLISANMQVLVGDWYANFVDLEIQFVFKLVQCANYLGIGSLLSLGCAKIASQIKGKTPDEISRILSGGN
jgi:S-phase kinase-associated protein 1